MSTEISLRDIPHRFQPLTENVVVCKECEGADADQQHHAVPVLNYPLELGARRLLGPTLIYLDSEGDVIELRLNGEQVQGLIDDWNSQPDDDREEGEAAYALRPPRAQQATAAAGSASQTE